MANGRSAPCGRSAGWAAGIPYHRTADPSPFALSLSASNLSSQYPQQQDVFWTKLKFFAEETATAEGKALLRNCYVAPGATRLNTDCTAAKPPATALYAAVARRLHGDCRAFGS